MASPHIFTSLASRPLVCITEHRDTRTREEHRDTRTQNTGTHANTGMHRKHWDGTHNTGMGNTKLETGCGARSRRHRCAWSAGRPEAGIGDRHRITGMGRARMRRNIRGQAWGRHRGGNRRRRCVAGLEIARLRGVTSKLDRDVCQPTRLLGCNTETGAMCVPVFSCPHLVCRSCVGNLR